MGVGPPRPAMTGRIPEERPGWAALDVVCAVRRLLYGKRRGSSPHFAAITARAPLTLARSWTSAATAAPSIRAPPDQPDGRVGAHSQDWSDEPFLDDLPIPDPATANRRADGLVSPVRGPRPPGLTRFHLNSACIPLDSPIRRW